VTIFLLMHLCLDMYLVFLFYEVCSVTSSKTVISHSHRAKNTNYLK